MQLEPANGQLQVDRSKVSRDVLWLGAGFSTCVTSGDLPVTGNFFDKLEDFRYPALHGFLKECFPNARKANVEEALVTLDQLVRTPMTSSKCRAKIGPDRAGRAKAELGNYCIERLGRFCVHPAHWAYRLMHTVDVETTVTTTNYDTVPEFILRQRPGLRHRNDGDPTCHCCQTESILEHDCACGPKPATTDPAPAWRGAILKLHGSTTWRVCPNPQCEKYQCFAVRKNPCDCACECCKGRTEPVIVLPQMSKEYELYPHLERMWNRCADALGDANRIFVFGFSFPVGDAAIAQLFRAAVIGNSRLRDIVVIDTNPDPVLGRLRALLPDRHRVELSGLTVPLDGSTPEWWKPGTAKWDLATTRRTVATAFGKSKNGLWVPGSAEK